MLSVIMKYPFGAIRETESFACGAIQYQTQNIAQFKQLQDDELRELMLVVFHWTSAMNSIGVVCDVLALEVHPCNYAMTKQQLAITIIVKPSKLGVISKGIYIWWTVNETQRFPVLLLCDILTVP